jgi:hypothetical protein
MSDFIQVTSTEGNKLYVRKDLVASVGKWLGKTHLTLTIDEVDYEIKETPEQVLKLIKGEQNAIRTATKHHNPARKQITCIRETRSNND